MRTGTLAIFLLFVLTVCTEGQYTYPQYKQYTLADGLPQMQVMSMFSDSRGYIWLGTKGGACFFNGEIFVSLTARDGMINEYVNCFAEDSAGRVWMGTRDGLACYDGKKLVSYPNNGYCSDIVIDNNGKIWFFGSKTTIGYQFGYFSKGEYTFLPDILNGIELNGELSISCSPDNNAIVINDSHSIYEFKDNRTTTLLNTKDTLINVKGSENQIMFAILENRLNLKLINYSKGEFLEIATISNGQIKGENHLKSPVSFSLVYTAFPVYTLSPDTLIINHYFDLQKNRFLFDRDNNLWIGSEEGLFRLFNDEFETFKKEYLPEIWNIGEDRNGTMWFGSFHFGLKSFDGKKFRSESGFNGLRSSFYFRTCFDKRGTLFIPSGAGLISWNGRSFDFIDNKPTITAFYDKKRDLILTGWQKNVKIYDSSHNLIRSIGEADGLECKSYIITINKDREDHYWFGSFSGLNRYDPETGKIVNYNRKNGRLPADGIVTIHSDYRRRTWFGSSNGLLWYDDKADSVRPLIIPEIDGDMSIVTSIDSTWLVFSQQAGIYLMDLQKYYREGEIAMYLYNQKNGFGGIEPGQDGAFTDSKGNIWMTTATEVVKLNPKNLHPGISSLNIRFTGCNGEPLSFLNDHFTLGNNETIATIAFDAICFNRPHSVLYSWKIEGSGNDWSPWKTDNYAVLSNLSDGMETVSLRAKIPGLPVRDFAYSTLRLDVRLALWKQKWFFPFLFVLFSALTLVSVVFLVRTRMKMVNAVRQAKMFQVQAIQTQMNPHFIFNALASLQSMILSLNMEKANEYLIKLANLIRGFLDASASSLTIENRSPRNSELPLQTELEILTNYISFQQVIHPEVFDVIITVDPDLNTGEETLPPMLIQPFVENAIRHGILLKEGKGLLEISVIRYKGNGLTFIIADDGVGIENALRIVKKSPFRYISRGRELTLNRITLLNELGYKIEALTESSEKGTKITINLNKIEYRN
jgi:ligand-binding sensor domain-containing protein/two-component sensor histidine kinase